MGWTTATDRAPEGGERPLLVVLAGPTAVGKTACAVECARALGTEVLNADARQIFRGMEIATAAPTAAEMEDVPHHFVACLDPTEPMSAGRYGAEARAVLAEVFQRRRTAVLAGGSGLYLHAVLHGLDDLPADAGVRAALMEELGQRGLAALVDELAERDPVTYERIDRANPHRVVRALEVCRIAGKPFSSFQTGAPAGDVPFDALVLGLDLPRPELHARIAARLDRMVADGMEDEARRLHPFAHLNALQTVGLREWFDHFEGKLSRAEALDAIRAHTRQYARRQTTWFRSMPGLSWVPSDAPGAVLDRVRAACAARGLTLPAAS
jgi:tRNA dimethylallyltransferase